MTAHSVPRRGSIGFGIVTLVIVAVLLSLGFWQLQRRTQKHLLIAALTERLAGQPQQLPAPALWPALSPEHDEFRRVTFTATYEPKPDAMVYASGSAVRLDISGPVTWAFMPAKLADGATVVINAGAVQNTMQDRAQQDRAVQRLVTGAPVTLTGYLRFPEAAGALTPHDDVSKRLWFTRDQRAMAQALNWGEVAPFYIDLESPVPASSIPKPGPLEVQLKDDHMQYAVTWFGLAAAVLVAFGVWLRGQRKA
ncbi:SURF1 family protein [Rhodopseudomonas sp. P2A-2r]|uniref:SURF1 family protein n=1 Tax=unclassified Rhodopseudomonas TaxID=2638247 RepID=UPI002233F65D|nr:SURF1 family cytochrome oxidase biogenesis protein [Rhodopseudomonas sp. P2A-2r]UZE49171.1 SURF1 family protein [Rhodopseudomonas sp. P2A-2r]